MSLEPLSPPATATPPPPPPNFLTCFRWPSLPIAALNLAVAAWGAALLTLVFDGCGARQKVPAAATASAAAAKLATMAAGAAAQRDAARSILRRSGRDLIADGGGGRLLRKMRYKRWLWWARFGMGITILQFSAALYLMLIIIQDFSQKSSTKECYLGLGMGKQTGRRMSVILFLVLAWLIAIIQCLTGSDILRWRSFYSTHDEAWRAHYLEVFDHGIREVMCCLGRVKYLNVSEEDEVYSVARILGDLVAYRASGTGHLEFLAGLALLQKYKHSQFSHDEFVEPPQARIRDAAAYHVFAEAAYTGPLLDFGRNPFVFPCVWMHRQEVLSPWTRGRRPLLKGDNWWRGHAAAFLSYAKLHPDSLRQGRICQTKREAAYFVVVLHQVRSIIIAIRGTETPEDILTDGLCKECQLTNDDLDGLINGCLVPDVRDKILSSTHYSHSGIVESSRELFMQLNECPGENDVYHSKNTGFLSSLLGEGRECHGYRICIVGHSLGGSVAVLLGIKLYGRYPNLHVYAYGPLPCVDRVVAEACSEFVTSIVYNDEFSARLSVNSIFRLRAAAVAALSEDSSANSFMISKLIQRNFLSKRAHGSGDIHSSNLKVEACNHVHRRNLMYAVKGGTFLCTHAICCMLNMPDSHPSSPSKRCKCENQGVFSTISSISETDDPTMAEEPANRVQEAHMQDDRVPSVILNNEAVQINFDEAEHVAVINNEYDGNGKTMPFSERSKDLLSENLILYSSDGLSSHSSDEDPQELFLPGLIVHIVPQQNGIFPGWKGLRLQDKEIGFKAFVAKRENFKDILVTPHMFLDHLPWRTHYALHGVLRAQNIKGQLDEDMINETQEV